MSTNSSAEYYQNNKERVVKDIKAFLKKKKKCNNMVVNNTKIYQKLTSKSLLSTEKNIK